MIRKKILTSVLTFAIVSAVCGCSSDDAVNQASAITESPAEITEAPAEITEMPAEPEEDKADIPEDENWRMSGSKEAFEAHFEIDEKEYKAKTENTGEMLDVTYHSEVVHGDRHINVYLPYGYDENKEYPVVYMIHGLGCDCSQWVSQGAANIIENCIAKGEVEPFIAVFPSVIPKDGLTKDSFSDENINAFAMFADEWQQDLHPYILANYSVSDKREDTAVCGLSMGGMEALRLGFSKLDRFAYIGSFSAAPSLEIELLTTEGSEYAPNGCIICSGDKDNTVGDNPYNYHMALVDNNVDHIWYKHPGGNHAPIVWNTGLVNFLRICFK